MQSADRIGNTILLVEDNEDDVYVFKRALKKADLANPLDVVSDGDQALQYFGARTSGDDSGRDLLPFLVFLDLKLPYHDGFQLLEWIRNQPSLSAMVVVVLTGSYESRDQRRAYSLGARSYFVKPISAPEIRELLVSLQSYWNTTGGPAPVIGSGTSGHSAISA